MIQRLHEPDIYSTFGVCPFAGLRRYLFARQHAVGPEPRHGHFRRQHLACSAQADINAGRGSKTTTIFTPPPRVYDNYGNVTRSPNVPSAGAGIATLAPIPQVPAGNIDLMAPLGTIDAQSDALPASDPGRTAPSIWPN
jgi:hypothetical protein